MTQPVSAVKTLTRAAFTALGLGAVLALSACGHSTSTTEAASADNVEIPAEEAMSGLSPAAVPMADSSDVAEASASSQ